MGDVHMLARAGREAGFAREVRATFPRAEGSLTRGPGLACGAGCRACVTAADPGA